ncbi:Nsp1-like C-terminal region-domain-containing protein [Hypoxylon trugodes]|uniref:Nsp1-like C-terminal region-domain-containing protein n=1 Tax=Hypoxylon trugodes TaxID=326681 RepID=UPI0021A17430|nr:Nsp1-like C-terminal region-domain-containing protein [Hypoxylon trugodes]KAI1383299.1 Nsp1-like C-terminal region-domain-containing protein [Hypoxylon trugodes]
MSLFGASSSAGQSNNATTSSAPSSGGLFGSTTTTTTTPGGLFGNNSGGGSSTGAPSFSFGGMGNNNTTASAASTASTAAPGNLFGNVSKPAEQKPLFGAAATSNPPGSLFGAGSQTSTSNIFGNKPAQSKIFGDASTAPTLPGSTMRSPPTTSAPPSSTFGANNNSSTPATSGTSTTTGLFGNLTSGNGGPGLFGGAGAGSTPANNTPGASTPTKPVFALNSTTPAGAPPAKPAESLFSKPQGLAPAQQGEQTGIPSFSYLANATAAQPASSAPSSSSVFANAGATPASNQASNLFGGLKPAESNSAPSIFGAKAAPSSDAGLSASSLFAQQASSKPAETSTKPAGSLFAAGATPTTSASTPSLTFPSLGGGTSSTPVNTVASAAPTTAQPSSLFANLNKPAANAATPVPAKTQAQASSMFANLGKPASSAATTEPAKPASSLFAGATATSTAGTTPAATTSQPAGAATSAATGPTFPATVAPITTAPFGAAAKPALSTDGAAAQPAAGAAPSLAASTAGPPSSMARLKNKTMDEIITRWATDLSKYQKEFKEQASQVAQWDRLLVENGERIQKLYLETFEAEKGSREIERQIVGIESQQEELESWLDRYEGEVDAMFNKQVGHGEQLAGPDQEREKTYKLAEKITEKLDDMGRDLTKMIKEINDISGTLSKGSKPDDPLSQIVRVLNSHLAQLQWIDTNAATLQARVLAAQKERSTIGSHYGGPEQDNVDSFYRSYMGRR